MELLCLTLYPAYFSTQETLFCDNGVLPWWKTRIYFGYVDSVDPKLGVFEKLILVVLKSYL